MAMRSSGGSGVLIALIIFIFLTVGSATAAILLYGQKTSANEELYQEKAVRTELMRESERESVATLLQEANRSLALDLTCRSHACSLSRSTTQ